MCVLLPGECLSGALQWRTLMKLATEIGFAPPVLVTSTLYTLEDAKVKEMLGKGMWSARSGNCQVILITKCENV